MCNIDKEKLDSIVEAFKSSDIKKCIDLGFDDGICNDRKEWYEAIIASSAYKQNKANTSDFYLMEKKDERIVITHNGNVYKLVCNDSIKYAISTITQTSKSQKQYKVASVIPKDDAEGLDVVKDLSPVCCDFVKEQKQKNLIALFNSKKSSNRVFNEVHFYPKNSEKNDPNITIGFGHFAKKGLERFFPDMKDSVRNKMIDFMCFLLYNFEVGSNNGIYIIDEVSDTALSNNRNLYEKQIKNNLDDQGYGSDIKTKLNKFFSRKEFTNWWIENYPGQGKGENIPETKPSTNMMIGIWFCDLLRYALLLEDVCQYQMTYWTNQIYNGSIEKAENIGYKENEVSDGLIAVLASWKSNGWSNYKGEEENNIIYNLFKEQVYDGIEKVNSKNKYRLHNGIIQEYLYNKEKGKYEYKDVVPTNNFNNEFRISRKNKKILVSTSIEDRDNTNDHINDLINKKDFDSVVVLVIWLAFNHHVKKMRSRQKTIWDLILKDKWKCGKVDKEKIPNYNATINDIEIL